MRCLLPLAALLGAASAVPFFLPEFYHPHHRPLAAARVDAPLAAVPVAQPVVPVTSDRRQAVFSFKLPQIDLSDIFKPFNVFASVDVNKEPALETRVPSCDEGKFDLTDEEFDTVMECQKQFSGSDVQLKECMLTQLPKTAVELRDFLDREEFGVAGLSSSFSLSLTDGEFAQKRSVTFSLCPRDEINAIDAVDVAPVVAVEEVPVVVEEAPVDAVANPDRLDASAPSGVAPPKDTPVSARPPLFQFPPIELPDFSGLFAPFLGPFRRPAGAEGEQRPTGLFPSLFPGLVTPQESQQPDVDLNDCVDEKFEVSREVFNDARQCQREDDYRQCLKDRMAGDADASEFVDFAADPSGQIVASSFSSFQTIVNFRAKRKNVISLTRCAMIPTTPEETVAQSEVTPEQVPDISELVPENPETVPEVVPAVVEEPSNYPPAPEQIPEVPEIPAEKIPEIPDIVPETPKTVPETPETVPETPVAVPEVPEVVPDTPVAVPEVPEAVPETPVAVPETPEVVPETPEVVPETPEVVPETLEPIPETPEVLPETAPEADIGAPSPQVLESAGQGYEP